MGYFVCDIWISLPQISVALLHGLLYLAPRSCNDPAEFAQPAAVRFERGGAVGSRQGARSSCWLPDGLGGAVVIGRGAIVGRGLAAPVAD